MSDGTADKKAAALSGDPACEKVARYFKAGDNCDKSVLKVLQEVLNLPADRWDWQSFYSEKPDDTERFACKALAAGALGIYLSVVSRWEKQTGKAGLPDPSRETERAAGIMNAMLVRTSGDHSGKLKRFDPFAHDPQFVEESPDEDTRNTYFEQVALLVNNFHSRFEVEDCVDILGFDPFNYENYDEETQEQIESGEWMKECRKCMQQVVACIGTIK